VVRGESPPIRLRALPAGGEEG